MQTNPTPDLVIIGFDPAGYDLALAAARLGARVVFATNGETGADFALRDGEVLRRIARWSDLEDISTRMVSTRAGIDITHSPERLAALGIRVIHAPARFIAPRRLLIGEEEIAPRRVLLATGRHVPAGESAASLLSKIAAGETLPRRLALAGGGSDRIVLAQILRRLGMEVTLARNSKLLSDEEPEAAMLLATALRRDGITLLGDEDINTVLAEWPVLRCPARLPALANLGLEQAEITTREGHLVLDGGLATSAPHVYAIGSLTTMSERATPHPGAIGHLIGRMFFRKGGVLEPAPELRSLATRPGLAATGLTEAAARAAGHDIRIIRRSLPVSEAAGTPGLLKVVTSPCGRIRGVTIHGAEADELIAPWLLGMTAGLPLGAFGMMPAGAGSLASITRDAGFEHARSALSSSRLKGLLALLRYFG